MPPSVGRRAAGRFSDATPLRVANRTGAFRVAHEAQSRGMAHWSSSRSRAHLRLFPRAHLSLLTAIACRRASCSSLCFLFFIFYSSPFLLPLFLWILPLLLLPHSFPLPPPLPGTGGTGHRSRFQIRTAVRERIRIPSGGWKGGGGGVGERVDHGRRRASRSSQRRVAPEERTGVRVDVLAALVARLFVGALC